MKKLFLLLMIFLTINTYSQVSVTPASGGINISGTRAENGTPGNIWTTLGNIVITESANSDFATGTNVTLILTAPANWKFNSATAPTATVSSTGRPNVEVVGVVVSTADITLTLTVTQTNKNDVVTISGIQVMAIDGSVNTQVNILRTGGTATINGITSTTNFGTLSSDGVLPVELSSFSASVVDNAVKLNWKTETEVNNYGFEIHRTTSPLPSPYQGEGGVAGRGWEKIGFVNGNGNSNSPKSYSFTDTDVLSGKYSYRLKQIDNDGQFEYSKTIEVDLGAPSKFELAQNFPNPFNPETSISFTLPVAGSVKLTVYNLLGQEVQSLVNEYKEAGTHIINFNASEFNSGVYIYKLVANGVTQTRKMTLIK
jgi:hypothetical protein